MKKGLLPLGVASYMWKIFMTVIVLVVFVFFMRSYVEIDIGGGEAELDLYFYRLLYSKDGISYFDLESERLYPGIIDFQKMVNVDQIEEHLNSVLNLTDGHLGIKFEIRNLEDEEIISFYYDQGTYENLIPLSFSGDGPGSTVRVEHSLYVLLRDKYIVNCSRFLRNHDVPVPECFEPIDSSLSAIESMNQYDEHLEKAEQKVHESTFFNLNDLYPAMLKVTLVKRKE